MALRRARRSSLIVTAVAVAVTALVPAAASGGEPGIDLRVDADRDGSVDVTGGTSSGDDLGEEAGQALFLPNLDDDQDRCREFRRVGRRQVWLPDRQLNACRDGADEVVNGAADAADLAPIHTVPWPGAPADAVGTLDVGSDRVRVFAQDGARWRLVTPRTRFTAAQLRAGLRLGIEGRDIARDARAWDGTARLTLAVASSSGNSSDTVLMASAPMLSHHHLQLAEQVLVQAASDRPRERPWRTFNQRLASATAAAGVPGGLRRVPKPPADQWVQDYVEPMYAAMPGADGQIRSIRLLLRSDQARDGSKNLYRFRGLDTGVVWLGPTDRWSSLDSFGNLETIPPYSHNGADHPAGRIVMGARKPGQETLSERMQTVLRTQGMQTPLILDTSFLTVGHVDEQLQFLPADTPRGWRLAVASPRLGLDLLRQAQEAGQGDRPVVRRNAHGPALTVSQALRAGSGGLVDDNERAAQVIDANVALLKAETGLSDDEILQVPTLYRTDDFGAPRGRARTLLTARLGPGGAERVAGPDTTQSAYVPGAINNLVLNRTTVLAARQFSVQVEGRDLFETAVAEAYASVGITVRWIDDWRTYHVGLGEVHCGTNTLRDTTAWWT